MAVVGPQDRLVNALTQFGFTSSDAKAYLALLKSHPATGYELTAFSGIPRSAIYNVLRRLEGLNVVNRVNDKPAKYVPLPPERLFLQLENRCRDQLGELKNTIESLPGPMAETSTWTIRGYQPMIQRAREMIGSATRSVYASIWGREARRLGKSLKKAVDNGLQVVLFSFTALPDEIGNTIISYKLNEKELEEYWPHRLILVCDNTHLLVGDTDEREDNRVVATDEAALVEIALSNLVLDITLYGQRTKTSTHDIVSLLTERLAPMDDLLTRAMART